MRIRGLVFLAIPVSIYACATSDEVGDLGLGDASPDVFKPVVDEDVADTGKKDTGKQDAKLKDAAKADTGQEGDPCQLGASQTDACGKCGTHERVCLTQADGGGGWGAWGLCSGEKTGVDACDPSVTGADEACGNCGKRDVFCDPFDCSLTVNDCVEPIFNGVPACTPASKQFKLGASCPNANEGRFQTCDTACMWGVFGACEVLPPPPPGSQRYIGGSNFECGMVAGGTVKCWGTDGYGQLGDGAVNSSTPYGGTPKVVQPLNLSNVQTIAGGYYHGCAIESGGSVKCWGDNFNKQIPGQTVVAVVEPVVLPGLSGVQRLAAASSYTCALLTGGSVKCWGLAPGGTLFTSGNTPVALANATGISALAVSSSDICGITTGGGVKCWNPNNTPTPVTISGISGAVEIRMGAGFGCVRLTGGNVKCWGSNTSGQLGDGTKTASLTAAVSVFGLTDVAQLALGSTSACALTNAHKVKCWGYLAGTNATSPVEHTGYPFDAAWIGMTSLKLVAYSNGAGLFSATLAPTTVPTKIAGF